MENKVKKHQHLRWSLWERTYRRKQVLHSIFKMGYWKWIL